MTASPSRALKPKVFATASVATVQFIVQINGSQPPLDEQNAAQPPASSTTGCMACANSVPEVPRLMLSTPAATLPVPMAAIMLSPPPAETHTFRGRPNSPAMSGERGKLASGPTSGGRHADRSRYASVAASSGLDHWRVRTSSQPVPEASPYSIQRSPVSQKFT
jgi:hypothetical protein